MVTSDNFVMAGFSGDNLAGFGEPRMFTFFRLNASVINGYFWRNNRTILIDFFSYRYMRHGPKTNSSSAGTGTSESSLPESPDEHHFTHLKTSTYERPNFVYAGMYVIE